MGERAQPRYRWLFFSDDGVLVGAVFVFARGLRLAAYPVLRQTLSQLTPSREFFLDSRSLLRGDRPLTALLYRTGDKTTTTQYVVRPDEDGERVLLVAAFSLDPYEHLLDATNPEFLDRAHVSPAPSAVRARIESDRGHDKAFLAAQQFARGEAALFGSCGTVHNDVAMEAYRRAITLGLADPLRLAEAHYRLGLALRNAGRYADALAELQRAIKIRPHRPAFHNTAGTLLVQLGETSKAIEEFEYAIALRPNYARARFNLAETLEPIDPRRAIEEYETYLSLVEGLDGETARAMLAQERLQRLKTR